MNKYIKKISVIMFVIEILNHSSYALVKRNFGLNETQNIIVNKDKKKEGFDPNKKLMERLSKIKYENKKLLLFIIPPMTILALVGLFYLFKGNKTEEEYFDLFSSTSDVRIEKLKSNLGDEKSSYYNSACANLLSNGKLSICDSKINNKIMEEHHVYVAEENTDNAGQVYFREENFSIITFFNKKDKIFSKYDHGSIITLQPNRSKFNNFDFKVIFKNSNSANGHIIYLFSDKDIANMKKIDITSDEFTTVLFIVKSYENFKNIFYKLSNDKPTKDFFSNKKIFLLKSKDASDKYGFEFLTKDTTIINIIFYSF